MNNPDLTVYRAESFRQRLLGLLARPPLVTGEALLLSPCNSVHSCFMRYPIDVVFLDRECRVLRIVEALQPWRALVCRRAHAVLELSAGDARRLCLTTGCSIASIVRLQPLAPREVQ